VYFSAENGLAESEAVFLKGCNLPEAWAGRDRFVVGELGLGTGLNLLALIRLWRSHRPKGGHLHIFTLEAHPLSEAQARRALAAWPEISDLAERLLAQWPGQARGFHRISLPDLGVFIDIAIMEALSALKAWDGHANAWFLDGFSPATNPQMWRAEVLEQIAAHCAPGAMVATFTVAGAVRRGLAEQGFEVAKRPGFGRKRERLEAIWPSPAAVCPPPPRPARVAIIGAGIAGDPSKHATACFLRNQPSGLYR
jgi:tRNA 5-methylaminomethyl-2-thiouridine biosynthesis bifunctional protein